MTIARVIFCSLFILLVTTVALLAQQRPRVVVPIPVVCMSLDDASAFVRSFGETLFWTGRAIKETSNDTPDGIASLFVNLSNGSWTYLETHQNVSCIIAVGDKSQQINFGYPI